MENTNSMRKVYGKETFDKEGPNQIDWEDETVTFFANLVVSHFRQQIESDQRMRDIEDMVKAVYLIGRKGIYDKLLLK